MFLIFREATSKENYCLLFHISSVEGLAWIHFTEVVLEDVQGSVVLSQKKKVAVLTKTKLILQWSLFYLMDDNYAATAYPRHILPLELRLVRISPNVVQSGLMIECSYCKGNSIMLN